MVTGTTREILDDEVKPAIEDFLHERGLALSVEKTRITSIEEGFDFLGQNIRKYDGKLLIKPARQNVQAFLNKVRSLIKANSQTTAGHLITQLNPLIRGWAAYHRHVVSADTFHKVRGELFLALWRWAKRRHPTKRRKWIKQKYFTNQWDFFGAVEGKQNTRQRVQLDDIGKVHIQRHIKIRGQANPYDPQWEPYFEQRLAIAMAANLKGRRTLLYLWREQNGECPICQEKITRLTGWHSHHIVWRVHGGGDQVENRVLLHPNCHRQVHSRTDLSVVKPGQITGRRKA